VHADRAAIERALAGFVGAIDQRPPMHSALKHHGRALYEYAREGVEVERAARRVSIHAIDIVEWQSPTLVIDVRCSKGTYIRTLAEDIGAALGCGAHLAALRRTASGSLTLAGALTLEALAEMDETARESCLLPPDALLAGWPEVRLAADEAGRFLTGLRRRVALADAAAVRVYASEPPAFLGSAHIAGGELIADRLLSPLEVQATNIAPTRAPLAAPQGAVGGFAAAGHH
jgi:tRNA pseudouridine55 synthase